MSYSQMNTNKKYILVTLAGLAAWATESLLMDTVTALQSSSNFR